MSQSTCRCSTNLTMTLSSWRDSGHSRTNLLCPLPRTTVKITSTTSFFVSLKRKMIRERTSVSLPRPLLHLFSCNLQSLLIATTERRLLLPRKPTGDSMRPRSLLRSATETQGLLVSQWSQSSQAKRLWLRSHRKVSKRKDKSNTSHVVCLNMLMSIRILMMRS